MNKLVHTNKMNTQYSHPVLAPQAQANLQIIPTQQSKVAPRLTQNSGRIAS